MTEQQAEPTTKRKPSPLQKEILAKIRELDKVRIV